MDFATTDLRASACNVFFLDRLGIPFAGLYQDPDQPLVLFQQALQELVSSFDFEFANDEKLES